MGIWAYFNFWPHFGLRTRQEPSYLGKIALVSIWFKMVLTQTILIFDWDYNFDTHSCVSLIPLLMLIINSMHSPIYCSNIGYYLRQTYKTDSFFAYARPFRYFPDRQLRTHKFICNAVNCNVPGSYNEMPQSSVECRVHIEVHNCRKVGSISERDVDRIVFHS